MFKDPSWQLCVLQLWWKKGSKSLLFENMTKEGLSFYGVHILHEQEHKRRWRGSWWPWRLHKQMRYVVVWWKIIYNDASSSTFLMRSRMCKLLTMLFITHMCYFFYNFIFYSMISWTVTMSHKQLFWLSHKNWCSKIKLLEYNTKLYIIKSRDFSRILQIW